MYSRRIHHDMLMAINNMYVCVCARIFSFSCFDMISILHLLSILCFFNIFTLTRTLTPIHFYTHFYHAQIKVIPALSRIQCTIGDFFHSFVRFRVLSTGWVRLCAFRNAITSNFIPSGVADVNELRIGSNSTVIMSAYTKQCAVVTAVLWINFDSIFKKILLIVCSNVILSRCNHSKQNAFHTFTVFLSLTVLRKTTTFGQSFRKSYFLVYEKSWC